MKYVIDTNALRTFFRFYYRQVTPELYDNLDKMIKNNELISVKEVYNEMERQHQKDSDILKELKNIKHIFLEPTNEEEINIVQDIYKNINFRNNIKEKNILNGRPVADAFLVAKAKIENAVLITSEKFYPNAAKIPNMCEKYDVKYINYEQFLIILKNY